MRILLLVILILFNSNSYSRNLLIADREYCINEKGLWRQFSNSCANECNAEPITCMSILEYNCDCGTNKCWSDRKCIDRTEFELKKKQRLALVNKEKEESKKKQKTKIIKTSINKAKGGTITLDNNNIEKKCHNAGGVWKKFNNLCADSCQSKVASPICAQSITFSCDCGKGKCWNKDQCTHYNPNY